MTKPGNDTEAWSHEPVDIEGAVGRSEICILLDVPKNTLDSWIKRRQFPKPFAYRSGTPLWQSVDILVWAEKTGRLPNG